MWLISHWLLFYIPQTFPGICLMLDWPGSTGQFKKKIFAYGIHDHPASRRALRHVKLIQIRNQFGISNRMQNVICAHYGKVCLMPFFLYLLWIYVCFQQIFKVTIFFIFINDHQWKLLYFIPPPFKKNCHCLLLLLCVPISQVHKGALSVAESPWVSAIMSFCSV